jgi:hypothetical protein
MSKVNFVNTVSIKELRTLVPLIGSELTPIIQSEPGCGKTSLLNMMREDLGDGYDYISCKRYARHWHGDSKP